ncbi:type II toxin-antitoxin system RelE/ParE family toxin [Sulfurimonas sp.]
MKVNFSLDSKEFILELKNHISKDNPSRAKQYTLKLVSRIKDMLQHPYIGKVNTTFDEDTIREIILDGMKIIYKIYPNSIAILMIYRYIDFDESNIEIE